MNRAEDDVNWGLTTWEGSRRAQLRRWLALSTGTQSDTLSRSDTRALLGRRHRWL